MFNLHFMAKAITVLIIFVFLAANSFSSEMFTEAPELNFIPNVTDRNGFIPPRMDLSHLKGNFPIHDIQTADLPAQWDWRTSSKVTSVKDQGSCGACYAFAALANIESKMLIDGESTYDFSENNVKECNWYESSCSGGNYFIVANYLSKNGTALEADDPYQDSDGLCDSGAPFQKTLLDFCHITGNVIPSNADLKNYLYNNGPLYTTMYAGDGDSWYTEMSTYDGSYTLYYLGTETPNHAVTIIGWDDDLVHSGGTGGWIVKNSWGSDWGGTCGYGSEKGYFTIAYGSASIGMYSGFMDSWQNYSDNVELKYYDEAGWTTSYGSGSSETCWGMCKFTPSTSTYLKRVEFWTNDVTTDIDIFIYDDFDGSNLSTLLASKLNSSFTEAGYHSVSLDSPLQLSSGDPVYVAVKFTNESYNWPITADDEGGNETGKTYISIDGATWYDAGTNYSVDIGIRIRTDLTSDISDNPGIPMPNEVSLTQNFPNPFNAATVISLYIPGKSRVSLEVYNLAGQQVDIIQQGILSRGYHDFRWNASEFPSGVYLYKLTGGDYSMTRKMVLLR